MLTMYARKGALQEIYGSPPPQETFESNDCGLRNLSVVQHPGSTELFYPPLLEFCTFAITVPYAEAAMDIMSLIAFKLISLIDLVGVSAVISVVVQYFNTTFPW